MYFVILIKVLHFLFKKFIKLMEDKNIEKIIEIPGNNHKYQYRILFLTFGIWVSLDILSISLPYLEKMPTVSYKLDNGTFKNSTLTYKICETKNYTIIEKSGHSWVVEYNIYCDRVKTGLIGSFAFLGVFIGSILFQYLSDNFGRKYTMILAGYSFSILLLSSILFNNNFLYGLYVASIFVAISAICGCLSSYLLMNEVSAIHLRSSFSAAINSAFAVCGIIYILLYYYFDSWRLCFIIGSIFNLLITITYHIFSFESCRYYLHLNEVDLFINNLNDISIVNGKQDRFNKMVLSEYNKEFVHENIKDTIIKDEEEEKLNNEESSKSFVSANSDDILLEEDEIK